MTNEELIEKVKAAYKLVGKVPSRGAEPDSHIYGSAIHVLGRAARLLQDPWLSEQTAAWLNGFTQGFEWVNGQPRWNETKRGMEQGIAVATAIFTWDDAPTIHHPIITRETDRDKLIEFLAMQVEKLQKELSEIKGRLPKTDTSNLTPQEKQVLAAIGCHNDV